VASICRESGKYTVKQVFLLYPNRSEASANRYFALASILINTTTVYANVIPESSLISKTKALSASNLECMPAGRIFAAFMWHCR